MFVPTLGNDGGKIEGKGRGRKEGRRRAWATKVGRRGLARDVSTFVEAEPTAVFVCHLCPFRAEPRARANGPPDGLDKEEKRLFGICSPSFFSLSLSVVASKGRQNRFPKFPRGPPMAACIDSQRCDYTRTPSSLFTDSFRSTRIRHAFSTRPLYSVPFRPFPSSPISENNGHCPLFLPLRF